jgi:hypothetical protein
MVTDSGSAGQAVLEKLEDLSVGEGVSYDRMTVFPAFASFPIISQEEHEERRWELDALLNNPDSSAWDLPWVAPHYRTLGEAITEGWATVTEEAQATVPELILWNQGKTMVLVLDGEEIVGGNQNRIANASFLIGAGSKVAIPVTCVEHGRWHEVSDRFQPGEVSYHSLKREKNAQVRQSLQATGRPVADQMAVWDEVARRHAVDRVASPTGAMHALYESRSDALAGYERSFPYVERAIGFVVALNGRMAGADLFDQPRTAKFLWSKLVRSYALDALEGAPGQPVSRDRATRFLKRTKGAHCEIFPSLALGEDVRLENEGVVGSALVYEDTPIHVGLFRTHRNQHASEPGGRIARSSTRRRLH